MANVAPDSLSLSNAEVLENSPLGTLVGAFDGTDPDGDPLTYSLVDFHASSDEPEIVIRGADDRVVVDRFEGKFRYRDLDGMMVWTVFSNPTTLSKNWYIRTGYHKNSISYGVDGVFDELPEAGVTESEYYITEEGTYIWNGLIEYSIVSVDNGIVKSHSQSDFYNLLGESYFFTSKEQAVSFFNAKSNGEDTSTLFDDSLNHSSSESSNPFVLDIQGNLTLKTVLDFETDPIITI